MKNRIVELWASFKAWMESAFEDTAEASIYTTMWTDGYSDNEIDQALADYRETQKSMDKNEIRSNTQEP